MKERQEGEGYLPKPLLPQPNLDGPSFESNSSSIRWHLTQIFSLVVLQKRSLVSCIHVKEMKTERLGDLPKSAVAEAHLASEPLLLLLR